jgi:hypothetical protein
MPFTHFRSFDWTKHQSRHPEIWGTPSFLPGGQRSPSTGTANLAFLIPPSKIFAAGSTTAEAIKHLLI